MPDFKPGDIIELTQVSLCMPLGRYMVVPPYGYAVPDECISVTPLTGPYATEMGLQFTVESPHCRLILPFSDLNALLDQISNA